MQLHWHLLRLPLYTIYINHNVGDFNAAAPWNNTQSFPDPGLVYTNLLDDGGIDRGLTVTMVQNFTGFNPIE